MYILGELEDAQRVPRLPVYVDSPMAITATDLYLRHREDHSIEFTREEKAGDPLNTPEFHLARTVEESKQISALRTSCIIISASGMITGGRLPHHLKHPFPGSRNSLPLPHIPNAGTPRAALLAGPKTLPLL